MVGTWLNIGVKKVEAANKIPQNKTLRPVLAPDLIAAALSGDMRIGGPPRYPDSTVAMPHAMRSQLPRGIEPSAAVSRERSLRD